MSETSNRQIRKFNPGTFQSDEELIQQFVVRKHELGIVLETLRGNIDAPSCQHVLVVAPRGRGKTMLLARAAAEIRANDELAQRLLPVRFMEESQEIFNMADFWLEALYHLARENAPYDPDLAQELRTTHADLSAHWGDRSLEDRARAAVLGAADRLDRKLVLMVENLQSICDSVDADFGWKLRGALQSEPKMMLLASATSRFEGLDDAEQPFFELFRIIGLEPLNTEECRLLWQAVSGDAVSGREVRPLQILTGGSPRLLVIVAGFAQHHSLRQLMEELVTLIDEHTEYFRSHLEVLAKTERRVYLAVIDLWRPSSTAEIAVRARMDVRTVSTMLGRLVERGAVIVEGSGKKRMYAAAERLYSIYYKLRRERDEAAIVENLIRFMVVFYNEAERAKMFPKLFQEAKESPVFREGIERAFHHFRLELQTKEEIRTTLQKINTAFNEIHTAFEEKAFERIIEISDKTLATLFTNLPDSSITGVSELSESDEAYLHNMKTLAYFELGEFKAAIATCNMILDRFEDGNDPELLWHTAIALDDKGKALAKLSNFEEAIATYDELVERFGDSDAPEVQWCVISALVHKGKTIEELGDFKAAIIAYEEVIKLFAASNQPEIQWWIATALFYKGNVERELGDCEVAIATYNEIVERFSNINSSEIQERIVVALVFKGIAQENLGDFGAAIMAYKEVVERFSDNNTPELQRWIARALADMGIAQTKIGQTDEALHTCEELERRLGILDGEEETELRWRAIFVQTNALLSKGNLQAAMDAFGSAYSALLPSKERMMIEMLRLVPNLIEAGASPHELVEIIESDEEKSSALAPLIVALRQHAGETVRAPAEVLEVAADILERIKEQSEKGVTGAT